jgi:hypothetical protein
MIEFLDIYDIGNIYNDVYLYRRKASASLYVTALVDSIRETYRKRDYFGSKIAPTDGK